MLEYRVLGPLEVLDDGRPLPLGGPKQRSVLAMLVLEVGRVVSVDRLVEGTWGEDAPAGAGRSLQVYVSNLRKVLEPVQGEQSVLVGRPPGYVLEADPRQVDALLHEGLVDQARRALAAGRHVDARGPLADAAALWRGEPLADLLFAPFAGPVVARLGEARADAAEDLVEAEIACGRHAEVLATAEAMVEEMPLRERRWGLLMLAQYRSGRQADALRTYARARDTLVDELGIDPGPALRDLESRILLQDPTLGGAAPQVEPRAEARPVAVPSPTTSIVGREEEVDRVLGLLGDPATRCVTLTGPGGVGKTRLSLEVAPAAAGAFPGGVVHVPLATVDDPALVVPSLGRALGLAEPPDGGWAEAVVERVGAARTLVVLDNLEQLPGAAGPLADLLARAPSLVLLGTSRVPLRIGGEREHPVPPLALPSGGERDVDELAAVPSVALFLERARDRAATIEPSPAALGAVAAVCERLDGLPLALELAAARVRLLGPEGLLDRLEDSLGLLVGGGRDLPDRQRTLRATLEWSHDLLAPEHRDLLARLGVFAGSFTVESAEAVCGDGLGIDVLDGLGTLVDNSLVRPLDASGGALRFGLLQTVREFARERLEATGAATTVRDRHATAVVRAAAAARTQIDTPGAAVASALLRADEANHRAAMEHLLGTGRADDAARLAVALRPHWVGRGLFADGRRWLREVLAAPALTEPWRARASVAAGILAYYQDDLEEGVALLEAGHAGAGADGTPDPETAALALCFLGSSRLAPGTAEEVATTAAEALALAEAHGAYEPHALALSLAAMAAAVAEDYDEEVRLHEARLELVRRRGDRERVADTLNTLAEIALDDGDAGRARRLAEEAVELVAAESRLTRRDLRLTLARAALAEGDPHLALDHLGVALPLCIDLAQPYETAQCLRTVAAAAAASGDHEVAARLFGAGAAAAGDDDGGEEGFPEAADLEAGRVATREALGGDAFAARERAGSLLGLDDAVALAREVLALSGGASARSSAS